MSIKQLGTMELISRTNVLKKTIRRNEKELNELLVELKGRAKNGDEFAIASHENVNAPKDHW